MRSTSPRRDRAVVLRRGSPWKADTRAVPKPANSRPAEFGKRVRQGGGGIGGIIPMLETALLHGGFVEPTPPSRAFPPTVRRRTATVVDSPVRTLADVRIGSRRLAEITGKLLDGVNVTANCNSPVRTGAGTHSGSYGVNSAPRSPTSAGSPRAAPRFWCP